MPVEVQIEGLDELRARFGKFKPVFDRELKIVMTASLYTLRENVPEYPKQTEDTDYVRTGTLGRSLGASQSGQPISRPDIFEVKRQGGGMYSAEFGTRLNYAPYVIGETEQAWMHYRWWRISEVARRSASKIQRLFDDLTKDLAAFLDGKRGT